MCVYIYIYMFTHTYTYMNIIHLSTHVYGSLHAADLRAVRDVRVGLRLAQPPAHERVPLEVHRRRASGTI